MKELQELARKLLTEGTVKVVLGWEEGRLGPRPVAITDPAEAGRLIFDTRCVHNLAAYLNPRRLHITRLGKAAVVVKGCDARAVAGLIRETQVRREDVVLIGVRCGGVVRDPAGDGRLTVDTVADKCGSCPTRTPNLADHLVGELPPPPPVSLRRERRLDALLAMPHKQRWDFWQTELSRCIRCHACREACPLCFCARCVADKSQPQWVETSAHPRGQLSWNFIRAIHLAGRCVDCGECERACPSDIPLGLLNALLLRTAGQRYGHALNDDPAIPAPIGAFDKEQDPQDYMLYP